jgi:hypothetical protein
MTPGLLSLLRDIDERDRTGLGVSVEPSNNRATAVRLKLIAGRKMKCGHRKMYLLTAAGRELIK